MDTRKKLGCLGIIVLVIILLFSSCMYMLHRPAPVYETNDIADYGVVKGNYDNEGPQKFVSSFFPEKIEEYFSDVTYHYKAKKLDTYAFEMYLEFVIQDTEKYSDFIANTIGDNICEPFYFDPSYQAYYVANLLHLGSNYGENEFFIGNAKVGLVLFSEVEQRVIFYVLGMYDGGGATTGGLNYFFDKFAIDPKEYEKQTDMRFVDRMEK